MSTEFYWVAVVITTIISASRFTRLATVDKFPPVKAVRDAYEAKTDGTGWVWLTMCGYCFAFWAVWPLVLWGILAGVYPGIDPLDAGHTAAQVWWVFNGIFAMTYLAGIVMAYDGADGEDD